jgi:hypothetical protein
MGRRNTDSGMNRERGRPDAGKRPSLAYALAAVILWALVVYALSPLSRPQPARLAARAIQPCDQSVR